MKIRKSQWELQSMFDETFDDFITELKSGENTQELKNYFHKSVLLSKLLQEVSIDNAKLALHEAFQGVFEKEEILEIIEEDEE